MPIQCAAAPADVSFVFTIVLWPQLGQEHLRERAGSEGGKLVVRKEVQVSLEWVTLASQPPQQVGKGNLWVDVSDLVFPSGNPWTNGRRGLCFRKNVLHTDALPRPLTGLLTSLKRPDPR